MNPQISENQWYVYIVRDEAGRLYTGIAKDVERRFGEHKTGQKGARFFRFSSPQEIIHLEILPDRSSATRRECEIKKMKRSEKLVLIKKRDKPLKEKLFLKDVSLTGNKKRKLAIG